MTESEARAKLKALMTEWPDLAPSTRRFLATLHWRRRQAVLLAYGRQLPRAIVASRLGVSETTVSRDLAEACECYAEQSPRVEAGAGEGVLEH